MPLGPEAGLIPEIFAQKQAKGAAKTYAWHRQSLTQLWEFLEQRELTIVGRFGEHPVNLFRLHLRLRHRCRGTQLRTGCE